MITKVGYRNSTPINFQAKIPTSSAIEIVSERFLSQEGIKPIYKATSVIMGRPADLMAKDAIDMTSETYEFLGALRIAKATLLKQFPALENIVKNANDFFKNTPKTKQEISKWLEQQIKEIGSKELDVTPIKVTKKQMQKAAK